MLVNVASSVDGESSRKTTTIPNDYRKTNFGDVRRRRLPFAVTVSAAVWTGISSASLPPRDV